jgi:2,3-bisphosphoglycerate-independent phosphoglycerate mutase
MKKVLTIILDGFGMREDIYGNAVKNAGMSNFINIWNKYPHCLLKSASTHVNLPKDQCGFSEFGHKLIGCGRKIRSKLNIANDAFNKGTINSSKKIKDMIDYLKNSGKSIHIISVISDGGVASHIEHLESMLTLLQKNDVKKIYLDLITDGIDSNAYSSYNYIKEIMSKFPDIKISTLCGRYYAADINGDYNRTKNYYDLLMNGKGVSTPSIKRIIDLCYERKLNDTYLPPIKTKDFLPIDDNDVVLFMNLGNEVKQIIQAFNDETFDKIETIKTKLKVHTLFNIKDVKSINILSEEKEDETLCEYLGELGLSQARIAESLKEDSITYYLDGSRYIDIENCDNYIISSNKVETYDKKPEMNSLAVAKAVISCMEKDYDFIIANFANPDIIGHTGNYQATINGLQAIDICLDKLIEAAKDNFYKIIIVGSHANADTIIDRDNNIITKNTLSSVPFIIMDSKVKLYNGDLTMVAPTILKYLDITSPKKMKKTKTLFDEE